MNQTSFILFAWAKPAQMQAPTLTYYLMKKSLRDLFMSPTCFMLFARSKFARMQASDFTFTYYLMKKRKASLASAREGEKYEVRKANGDIFRVGSDSILKSKAVYFL